MYFLRAQKLDKSIASTPAGKKKIRHKVLFLRQKENYNRWIYYNWIFKRNEKCWKWKKIYMNNFISDIFKGNTLS